MTAFMFAAQKCRGGIAQTLLQSGVDLTVQDEVSDMN